MNISELIRELKEQRRRVDRTIAALEAIWEVREEGAAVPAIPSRRGRKAMPEPERLEVSRRMKEYWADWRKQRTAQRKKAAGGGAAAGAGGAG